MEGLRSAAIRDLITPPKPPLTLRGDTKDFVHQPLVLCPVTYVPKHLLPISPVFTGTLRVGSEARSFKEPLINLYRGDMKVKVAEQPKHLYWRLGSVIVWIEWIELVRMFDRRAKIAC